MRTTHLLLVSLIAAHVAVAPVRAEPPAPLSLYGGHEGDITHLAFSPDGKVLASASKGLVRLWDLATREDYASFAGEGPIGFSRGGNKILAAGRREGEGGWRYTRTGLPVERAYGGLASETIQLAISGNEDYIAYTKRYDYEARLVPLKPLLNPDAKVLDLMDKCRDYETLSLLGDGPSGLRVAFTAGGNILVVGPLVKKFEKAEEREISVLFYDLDTNEKRKVVLDPPRDRGDLTRYKLVAVARSGAAIATLRYPQKEKALLEVWDTATGKVTTRAARKESLAVELDNLVLELSDDGKQLAVMMVKSEIELWDVTTGKKNGTLAIPPKALKKYRVPVFDREAFEKNGGYGEVPKHPMAFSPDGKQLAVGLGGLGIAVYSLKR
jgi:WD40 repeat protein